ncbi:hypothetical protein B0O80DRAFT_483635, partial [Mortierella sp. GBAus27b]
MLLLVPSNKADSEGAGKSATSPNRVLVVLPSDTDLSSNVVVPDTAITTTLGTNDIVETISNLTATSPFSSNKATLSDPPRNSRDHLGIWQSFGAVDPPNPRYHPTQQPTTRRSPDRELSDYTSRSRRHSHTGLVDAGYGVGSLPHPRSRSRQSSHSLPYLYQPTRTLRALRNAFRQARRDQSPLLTSGSVPADCPMPTVPLDLEDAGPGFSRMTRLPASSLQRSRYTSPEAIASDVEVASADKGGSASKLTKLTDSNSSTFSIGLDGSDDGPNSNQGLHVMNPSKSFKSGIDAARRSRARASSDVMDVDEGSHFDERSRQQKPPLTKGVATGINTAACVSRGSSIDRNETRFTEYQDIDQDNLDADMNMILGMTSDMELVMPQFDDEYLEDLKNDSVRKTSFTQSSAVSATSPSCLDSSSTTITCISSQSSPRSYSPTPGVASAESRQYTESLPASPGVLAARDQCTPSIQQYAALLDHAKEDQDLPKDTDPDNPVIIPSRSSSSSPSFSQTGKGSPPSALSSTDSSERKANGPIYFKPRQYSMPGRHYDGEHSQQYWRVAPSNQWVSDTNRPVDPTTGLHFSFQGNTSFHGSVGHRTSRTQESWHPSEDKSTTMTAGNISLITSNMSVLTPQE